MITTACLCVLVTMALTLVRAIRGPSVYDRIVSVNTFGTMTVLLLVLLGFLTDRPEFQDIALVYVLINFVGIIAVLKFVKYNNLAGPNTTPHLKPTAPNANQAGAEGEQTP